MNLPVHVLTKGRVLLLAFAGLVAPGVTAAASLEDQFGVAAPIIGVTNVSASNILATAQALEPFHGGEPPKRTLWATWTANVTGTISISTSNSLNPRRTFIDTVLAVYQGDSLTNLSLISESDDAVPFNLWSRVFFRAYAGETFRIAIGVVGDTTNNLGNINLRIERPLPIMTPWTANGVNRGQISSLTYSNRILLVDFWETICTACVDEYDDLGRLHLNLEPRGVSMIGLAIDHDSEVVESWLQTHPVPYAIGMDSQSASNSLGGAVGMPVKYLVDQEGRVVNRFAGGIIPVSETVAYYTGMVELLLRPPPNVSLSITLSGGHVKATWPLSASGYRIESASSPDALLWDELNLPTQTNGMSLEVVIPVSEPSQFFRLAKP